MTTARDLALVALVLPPDRPVGQGDLSLALAGPRWSISWRAGH